MQIQSIAIERQVRGAACGTLRFSAGGPEGSDRVGALLWLATWGRGVGFAVEFVPAVGAGPGDVASARQMLTDGIVKEVVTRTSRKLLFQ